MKKSLIIALVLASWLSVATGAESNGTLTQRTESTLKKAGDEAVDAGRTVVTDTKRAGDALVDAVTPDSDARKIDVTLGDRRLEMPSSLKAGKTGFIVRNNGKENHSFEVRGEGIDKKFILSLSPSETKVLHVDLKPGTYKAFCPEKEHSHEGMSESFTVK